MLLRAKSRIKSRNAVCCSESSKSIALALPWTLAAPIDHRRALERDHLGSILIDSGRAYRDEADILARFRIANLEHLGPRIDGFTLEDGVRQTYFIPAQIRHHVLRHVAHALPRHQCQREAAV